MVPSFGVIRNCVAFRTRRKGIKAGEVVVARRAAPYSPTTSRYAVWGPEQYAERKGYGNRNPKRHTKGPVERPTIQPLVRPVETPVAPSRWES